MASTRKDFPVSDAPHTTLKLWSKPIEAGGNSSTQKTYISYLNHLIHLINRHRSLVMDETG